MDTEQKTIKKESILFKLGYISQKYTFHPKVFFIVFTLMEILLIMTLCSISYDDRVGLSLSDYTDFFGNLIEKDAINTKLRNFNSRVGYLFSILGIFTKMNKSLYITFIVILNLFVIIKIIQMLVLLFYDRGDIIKPTFNTKLFIIFALP